MDNLINLPIHTLGGEGVGQVDSGEKRAAQRLRRACLRGPVSQPSGLHSGADSLTSLGPPGPGA